jgi:hypothetical protein
MHVRYLDKAVYSINEVRAELGKEPVKNGDIRYIKLGNQIVFLNDLDNSDNITDQGARQATSGLIDTTSNVQNQIDQLRILIENEVTGDKEGE